MLHLLCLVRRLIEEELIQLRLIGQYELVQTLNLYQLLHELFQMAEVGSEEDEVAELTRQALANIHVRQLGVLVESRVINWVAGRLLLVHVRNELRSCQVRLLVLDDECVPLVQHNIEELDAVAVGGWRVVVLGKDAVDDLELLVDVTLEAAIAVGEAVEENWEVVQIKLRSDDALRLIVSAAASLLLLWTRYFELNGNSVAFLEWPLAQHALVHAALLLIAPLHVPQSAHVVFEPTLRTREVEVVLAAQLPFFATFLRLF